MIEPSSYRENGLLITSLFGSTLSFQSVLNNLIIKALYSIITVMFLCEVHKDIFMKGHFILFFLDPQSLCRPLYEHVPCPIRRFSFLYSFSSVFYLRWPSHMCNPFPFRIVGNNIALIHSYFIISK